MRKLFFTLAITLFTGLTVLGAQPKEYTKNGVVIEVIHPYQEHVNGLVTFIDAKGHTWSFEGSEDWFTGDYIEATMNDNGTESIQDDIIVKAIYTGYVPKGLWATTRDVTKLIK